MKKLIIGLSGKSCSGKNFIAELLQQEGFESFDADKAGHVALESSVDELIKVFGPKVITKEGKPDRKALGSIVFSDKKELKKLENITSKVIFQMGEEFCLQSKSSLVLINAAILHKLKLDELCDAIIHVQASFSLRARRAIERDGISLEQFRKRNLSQKSINKKNYCKSKPVFVVINRDNTPDTSRQIKEICDKINALRRECNGKKEEE